MYIFLPNILTFMRIDIVVIEMVILEHFSHSQNYIKSTNKIPPYAREYKKEYLFIRGINKEFKYFIDKLDDLNNGLFESHRHTVIFVSGPWILDSGFESLLVSEIPDTLSCISDSKTQVSGFHKQTISRIADSGSFLYMVRKNADKASHH